MILIISGPAPEPATKSEGPEHNARGFFTIGPQAINPSDVLARMMEEAKGTVVTVRSATPENERRQRVRYRGRMAALRRKYANHGIAELVRQLAR